MSDIYSLAEFCELSRDEPGTLLQNLDSVCGSSRHHGNLMT